LRPAVGVPCTDLQPDPMDANPPRVLAAWSPVLFTPPPGAGGSPWALMLYYLLYAGEGWRHEKSQGGFEHADVVQVEERNAKSQGDMAAIGVSWSKKHRIYRKGL
jgi:hypothetical protein